jgi:hypothetical protein
MFCSRGIILHQPLVRQQAKEIPLTTTGLVISHALFNPVFVDGFSSRPRLLPT